MDYPLGRIDLAGDNHVARRPTPHEIYFGTEYSLHLIKHLKLSMEFGLTTNESAFDEKIHIDFTWLKIVPKCPAKSETPLNALLAAEHGNGFLVMIEKGGHRTPLRPFILI